MAGSRLKYIIWGLVAIVIVYSLYNLCLVYVSYYDAIPRKVRHLNRLLSIIIVYGIGYYSFKQYSVKWMRLVWNAIYFTVALLLILIGLYDWGFGPAPIPLRSLAKTFHEFLISPVFFMVLVIINRAFSKMAVVA